METKEINSILKEGESEKVEFKLSLSQIDEIVQAVAGFANFKGGMILTGVSDRGEVFGIEIGRGSIENLANIINQKTEPKVHPEISVEKIDNKKIIVINVSESIDKPVLASGKLYKRVGKSTILASRNEFEKLVLEKHKEKILFDSQICEGAGLGEIDNDAIKQFLKLAREENRIKISGDNNVLALKKLNLMKDNKLTNAAVLLFGKNPRKFFSNALVKCGRFKGELKQEFFDIKDIDGDIFDCIQNSVNFLKDHLRLTAKIEGLYRKEKWEIPIEALREAVINALIHRDYRSQGFTYIKLYDDEIVIANPGKLPDDLKIDDLYKEHESIQRNPLLAEAVYYTGMIDAWGRGIKNIVQMLNAEGLPKPLFEESGGHFRIIFKRPKITEEAEKVTEKVTENQRQIIDLIQQNRFITVVELAGKIKISRKSILENISKLKEKGILSRVGADKGGYWEIR